MAKIFLIPLEQAENIEKIPEAYYAEAWASQTPNSTLSLLA